MRLPLGFVCIAACVGACGGGGGNGGGPDAGACASPLTLAWPSEADPQVCSRPPTQEAVRTQCGDIQEDCDDTGVVEPNLACLTSEPPVLPPDPATVTLTGYADVFSSGPDSNGARIEIYRAADIGDEVTDLAAVTPLATHDLVLDETTVATARACPSSRTDPEDLRGDCITPDTDCASCDVALDAVDFCYQTVCYELQRWEIEYSIPGIPTNTDLVIRTIGLTGGAPDSAHATWAPIVQYNVFFSTADPACVDDPYRADENCLDEAQATPRYRFNVNLLSRSDYETIPVTAGLSGGVPLGRGAVAGEVHDCDDIRVEFAQIGYDPVPNRPIYFNDNPVRTLPDLARADLGTSALALYSGLDIAPGPLHVVAIGLVDGVPTSLGEFRGRIWPDSVTIIGINGGKPVQEPQP
jgi:hypothetical protein